ncbi:MAG: PaaI family thioesterase [Acetobacteraceae bacterium]|nr:PaaI family thioesterase [Acetobacteraceae bacterium]
MTGDGRTGDVPEGYVRATHGGAFAASLGPFHALRGEREIRLGLRVQARHCNTAGVAHGGLVASLSDLGLIHAVGVLRERSGQPKVPISTVTLSLDYLGPAPEGCWLEARAAVTRIGGSLAFVEGAIPADAARVGRASAVFSVRGSSLRLAAQPVAAPGIGGSIA